MLSKQLQEAINAQIKVELDSAYTYLSISAYLESVNLPGIARWMRIQHDEEVAHGLKLFDYLNERGGRVVLQAIDRPKAEYKSVLDVFQAVLEHETKVSGLIDKLYELAVAEKEYATQVEMQWFVKEQVEEERMVRVIVEQLKMIGEHGVSLMMLDRQLGARTSAE